MIKVTVVSKDVTERRGTNKATQKAWHIRLQTVYCHLVDREGKPAPFPEKTEIFLDNGKVEPASGEIVVAPQAPYEPGEYAMHPASIYIDREGRLSCALRLTPIKRAAT